MRRDGTTIDMFTEWEPPQVAVTLPPETARGGTLSTRIARAVAHVLRECPMPREEIAAAMSDYLGQEVSKNMLDAYASQAREDHRISLERFMALIEVTGAHELVGFVAEAFGLIVVPERFRALIELHFIEEEQRRLEQRKTASLAKWRAGR